MLRRLSFYLGVLSAAVLIALIGALLLVLPYVRQFDPAVWLTQQTGRPVAIRGGINYFFFPWLGMTLDRIEIGQPAGSVESRPFLTADRIKVRVRLLPLLIHHVLVLDRVSLFNPTLTLRRYADGRANWDDLLGLPLLAALRESADQVESPAWLRSVSLSGVEAINGALIWDDSRNAEQLRFDAIRLHTGKGLRFHFELDFHLTDPKRKLDAKALLAGDCQIQRGPFDFALSDVDFGITATATRDAVEHPFIASGAASFSLAAQEFSCALRSLELFGLRFTLDAHGRRILSDAPEIQGKLVLLAAAPEQQLAKKLSPALLKRLANLKAETLFSFEDKRITLTELKAAAGDMTVQAKASYSFASEPGQAQASLAVSKLDLDEFFPETQASSQAASPLPDLRQLLAGKLALDLAEFKGRGLVAKDLALKATFAAESADATLRVGQVFGGNGEMRVEWKKQDLAATLELDRVQASLLTHHFFGREAVKGQTDLKIAASAAGDSLAALAASLQAKLDATLSGAIVAGPPSSGKPKTAAKAAPDALANEIKASKPLFTCDKASLALTLGQSPKNAPTKVFPLVGYGYTFETRCEGADSGQTVFAASPPSAAAANVTFGLSGRAILDTKDCKLTALEQTQVRAQYRGKALESKSAIEAKLTATADYNRERDALLLKKLAITLPHTRVNTDLDIRNLLNQEPNELAYTGSLSIPVFNPRETLRAFGFEMPVLEGKYTFHNFGLSAKVRGGLTSINLDNLNMLFDKSTVTGRYSLTAAGDPAAAPLSRFDFNIDDFDLDAYFPPREKEKRPLTPDDEWRLGIMRTLPLQGEVFLNTFKFYDLYFKNLKVYAEGPSGAIHVRRLDGGFYDGMVTGVVNFYFAPNHVFSIDTDLLAKDFQLGPAIHDQGGGDYVGGLSRFSLTLNSTGGNRPAFLGRLTGKAELLTKNGYCLLGRSEPAPPANPIGEMGKIGQQPPAPATSQEPYKTPFTTAKGSLTLKNGVVRNEDFVIEGGMLNAQGSGVVYLQDERMDYNLNLQMLSTPSYPIRIHGPFGKLTVETSESKMLKDTAVRIGGSFFDVFKGVLTLPFKAIDILKPAKKGPARK